MTDERIATDMEVAQLETAARAGNLEFDRRIIRILIRLRAAEAIIAAFKLAPVSEYEALDAAYCEAIAVKQK